MLNSNRYDQLFNKAIETLGFPLFVKPCCAGSSNGASKAENPRQLSFALMEAFSWDDKVLIEKAINAANLGVNPSNDGEIIRISIPALTEERRKELVKEVKKIGEDSKVAVRNVRRDSNDELKKQEKNGDITEDDLRTQTDKVQEVTDDFIKQIDDLTTEKEKDILEI